jgi:hypothetical protein
MKCTFRIDCCPYIKTLIALSSHERPDTSQRPLLIGGCGAHWRPPSAIAPPERFEFRAPPSALHAGFSSAFLASLLLNHYVEKRGKRTLSNQNRGPFRDGGSADSVSVCSTRNLLPLSDKAASFLFTFCGGLTLRPLKAYTRPGIRVKSASGPIR